METYIVKNMCVFNHEVRHFISQPEDVNCQVTKQVVVLYVINSIHISTDKYIHSSLVYVRLYNACGKLIANVNQQENLQKRIHKKTGNVLTAMT